MIEVILPVLDEAQAIPGVLAAFPDGFAPLVVDNGSRDASAQVAARLGARVVSEPHRGFGAACFAGLCAAQTDVVAFMDCDGSLSPIALPGMSAPILAGQADLVLGARLAAPGAWPRHARLANRLLAAELRRRTGAELTDLGSMRVARTEALRGLALRDRGSGWPLEMILRAAAAGWTITELPVAYGPRDGGRSKVSGSVRGTLTAIRAMSAQLVSAPAVAGRGT